MSDSYLSNRAGDAAAREREKMRAMLVELQAEVARLSALINNPHTEEFTRSVKLEAAHQQERWGTDHDAGKGAADWFWLLGYLSGKALQAARTVEAEPSLVTSEEADEFAIALDAGRWRMPETGDVVEELRDLLQAFVRVREDEARDEARMKLLHHIITTAAACQNWHANVSGSNTSMRPGLKP